METIQMKKQLLAVAVASAFASTAFAANVEVYGAVDTGLVYDNTSFGGAAISNKDSNKFSMDTGVLGASKFGLKGTEDLGDGYSVSFQLENGFDSDTGAMNQTYTDPKTDKDTNRIFGREARLSVSTPYGTVSFGRMGTLTSGAGTYDIFQAAGDSMDGGYSSYIGTNYWFSRGRYDNMLTFVTPEANGFTGYAQYSFNVDGQEDAHTRHNDRYAALGLTYKAGALEVALVGDMVMYSNVYADDGSALAPEDKYDDAKAISLGVNYDFGVTKAFFGAQYGKNEVLDLSNFKFIGVTDDEEAVAVVKGYNLHVGAATPLPCGTLTVSAYYGDYEAVDNNNVTAKKFGVALMHEYPISKRTTFYTGAGFAQVEAKNDEDSVAARQKGVNVTLGLHHNF